VHGAFNWATAKLSGEKAAQPVQMSGLPHTVSAQQAGDGIEVNLASSFPGRLVGKLSAAATIVNGWPAERTVALSGRTVGKADVLAAIAAARDDAQKTETELAAEWAKVRKGKSEVQAPRTELEGAQRLWLRIAEGRLSTTVSRLVVLPDLGLLANEACPEKRFLPQGYDARTRLYLRGRSWEDFCKTIRARDLPPRLSMIDMVGLTESTSERIAGLTRLLTEWTYVGWAPRAGDPQYKPPSEVAKGDVRGVRRFIETLQYDVHHKTPLASHWTTQGGNNMDDAGRRDVAYNPGGCELIEMSENRRQQADGDHYLTVPAGPNFTSVRAEGGSANARTIDGRSFLESANGKPIP
jgi:hypothetical protein